MAAPPYSPLSVADPISPCFRLPMSFDPATLLRYKKVTNSLQFGGKGRERVVSTVIP